MTKLGDVQRESATQGTALPITKEARRLAAEMAARQGTRFQQALAAELSELGLSLYGLALTLGISTSSRPTGPDWLRVFNYLALPQTIQGQQFTAAARLARVARALERSRALRKPMMAREMTAGLELVA